MSLNSGIYIVDSYSDILNLYSAIRLSAPYQKRVSSLLGLMPYPLTVVVEDYYVDKVYRDSYYLYFAGKHLMHDRNCDRLSFFKGSIDLSVFQSFSKEKDEELAEAFIGTVVLRPLKIGYVGRTLLDPRKLSISPCYVRLATFNVMVRGHEFLVSAFPFSSQDGETMTCAETTVWNILEYYGTRYPEYRTVLPSDIVHVMDTLAKERRLPSRGLKYDEVSLLLKSFGFAPRVYSLKAVKGPANNFHRLFHYYVESGIPVAMAICGKSAKGDVRHAIVGIGHAKERSAHGVPVQMVNGYPCINSADYYTEYVIMDDNQVPYVIQPYDGLTLFSNSRVEIFLVPLYKRILLEANDVEKIAYALLKSSMVFSSLSAHPELHIAAENNPLVIRIFLTSSRKFKKVRCHKSSDIAEASLYMNMLYPKFLWVVEVSTQELYGMGNIIGELVLDATASRHSLPVDTLLLVRMLEKCSFRLPHEEFSDLEHRYFTVRNKGLHSRPYPLYENNLTKV